MTDNLFERFAELFKESGPVNWRLAREIAESTAGTAEPIEPWLDEEYRELLTVATRQVDASTPLDASLAGVNHRILDRRTWASEHVEALGYLAEPLADRLGGAGQLPEALSPLGPALAGLQVGGLAGAFSHDVLGGFDVGLPTGRVDPPTLVAPNIERFATDHALDPRQVRLWAALHEVVHTAAMAIPWVRETAVMAADRFVETLHLDEEALRDGVGAMQDTEALERLVEGGGPIGGLQPDETGLDALDDMRTVMAVVEGYGDRVIADVAGAMVPEADRIRVHVDQERDEDRAGETMLAAAMGLELDHAGYRAGAAFCSEVTRRWGDEALLRLWESPENLPRSGELHDPVGWAARALL